MFVWKKEKKNREKERQKIPVKRMKGQRNK